MRTITGLLIVAALGILAVGCTSVGDGAIVAHPGARSTIIVASSGAIGATADEQDANPTSRENTVTADTAQSVAGTRQAGSRQAQDVSAQPQAARDSQTGTQTTSGTTTGGEGGSTVSTPVTVGTSPTNSQATP